MVIDGMFASRVMCPYVNHIYLSYTSAEELRKSAKPKAAEPAPNDLKSSGVKELPVVMHINRSVCEMSVRIQLF